MNKFNRIILLSTILTGLNSEAFELDVKIAQLRYEGNKASHELVDKTLVGYINAPSFRINTPRANFVLKNNFEFIGSIYRKDNWLILDNEMFEFTYSLTDVPKLNDIKFANFENLSLFTDDLSLSLIGEKGEFNFQESSLVIENIDFDCGLEGNIVDDADGIIDSCLNNSTISRFNKDEANTHIIFNSGNSETNFRLSDLTLKEEELRIKAENISFKTEETVFESDTISLNCPKDHYGKNFNDKSAVASCLKNAKIHAPRITFESTKNELGGEIEIEHLVSNGKRVSFFGPFVAINNKDQNMEFSSLDAFCKLPSLDSSFEYNDLIHGCMESSAIELKSFVMDDEIGHVKVNGASLRFFPEELRLNTPNVDIVREETQFKIKNISYSCANLPFVGGFENQRIAEGCFQESQGTIEDLTIEDAKTALVLKTAILNVNKNKLKLNAPMVSLVDMLGSLKVDFLAPSIECSRSNTTDMSVENILRGCFDSSQINVQSIEIKHERIDSNIQINEVSIDKKELRFNSPKGQYVLNGFDNDYKKFFVSCALNASYDLAKNHDWESVLENCLHSTKVTLDSLVSLYNGSSTVRRFGNSVKNFGIKGVNKLTFDSVSQQGTGFKLTISPEVLSFIPIHVTINGDISYVKGQKQIIMDVKNTYFYKIIPARFLVQLILNAFVADENIEVDGNRIIINLPVDSQS